MRAGIEAGRGARPDDGVSPVGSTERSSSSPARRRASARRWPPGRPARAPRSPWSTAPSSCTRWPRSSPPRARRPSRSTADLERYLGASTAMAAARNRFGRIDILINNVGGTIWAKPYAHYTEAEIEAEIRRSLFPTMWCCRARAADHGRRRAAARSSTCPRWPPAALNRVPYAAAKGGVNALTASLAWEYAEHGIRVVATAPGGIEAPPRRVPRGTGHRADRRRRRPGTRRSSTRPSRRRCCTATARSTSRPRRSCSWPPTRRPTSPGRGCRSPAVISGVKTVPTTCWPRRRRWPRRSG